MTLTPEQRKAIRARANAATKGPWCRGKSNAATKSVHVSTKGATIAFARPEDAAFIVHALKDVPDLLDALEEAEQERDAALLLAAARLDLLKGYEAESRQKLAENARQRERAENAERERDALRKRLAEVRRCTIVPLDDAEPAMLECRICTHVWFAGAPEAHDPRCPLAPDAAQKEG